MGALLCNAVDKKCAINAHSLDVKVHMNAKAVWHTLKLAQQCPSVTEQCKFKQQVNSYLYSYFLLFILFSPQYCLSALCPFPISKYIHTYNILKLNKSARFEWCIFFYYSFFFLSLQIRLHASCNTKNTRISNAFPERY